MLIIAKPAYKSTNNSNILKRASFISACLSCALASPAFAFQPLITDDTGTQGTGGNQLEFSYNHDRERSAGETTRTTTVPGVYTRGLTDTLDVFVSANHTRVRTNDPASNVSGGGNPSFGAKWRFYENEASKLSFGVKPEITLPVSTSKEIQGFGAGKTSYGLTFILTKEVSFGAVHANFFAGRDRFRESSKITNTDLADTTTTRASIAPTWDVTDKWKLALDVGSESAKADNVRTRTDFAEIGVIFAPNEDLEFALGIIRSIDDQQPKTGVTSATLGVTWRFK